MYFEDYKIPNDPEREKRENDKAFKRNMGTVAGMLVGAPLLFLVPLFFQSIRILYQEGLYERFFLSVGLLFLDLTLLFVCSIFSFEMEGWNEILAAAKTYFLFVVSGIFCVVGLYGVGMGVYFLCCGKPGVLLIILSFIGVCVVAFLTWLIFWKLRNPGARLFTNLADFEEERQEKTADVHAVSEEKKQRDSFEIADYIFCHKCGKRILGDSVFCSACGAKVKE